MEERKEIRPISTDQETDYTSLLPEELWLYLLSFLDDDGIEVASLLSKFFRRLALDPQILNSFPPVDYSKIKSSSSIYQEGLDEKILAIEVSPSKKLVAVFMKKLILEKPEDIMPVTKPEIYLIDISCPLHFNKEKLILTSEALSTLKPAQLIFSPDERYLVFRSFLEFYNETYFITWDLERKVIEKRFKIPFDKDYVDVKLPFSWEDSDLLIMKTPEKPSLVFNVHTGERDEKKEEQYPGNYTDPPDEFTYFRLVDYLCQSKDYQLRYLQTWKRFCRINGGHNAPHPNYGKFGEKGRSLFTYIEIRQRPTLSVDATFEVDFENFLKAKFLPNSDDQFVYWDGDSIYFVDIKKLVYTKKICFINRRDKEKNKLDLNTIILEKYMVQRINEVKFSHTGRYLFVKLIAFNNQYKETVCLDLLNNRETNRFRNDKSKGIKKFSLEKNRNALFWVVGDSEKGEGDELFLGEYGRKPRNIAEWVQEETITEKEGKLLETPMDEEEIEEENTSSQSRLLAKSFPPKPQQAKYEKLPLVERNEDVIQESKEGGCRWGNCVLS